MNMNNLKNKLDSSSFDGLWLQYIMIWVVTCSNCQVKCYDNSNLTKSASVKRLLREIRK